jgi:hypothetical protein
MSYSKLFQLVIVGSYICLASVGSVYADQKTQKNGISIDCDNIANEEADKISDRYAVAILSFCNAHDKLYGPPLPPEENSKEHESWIKWRVRACDAAQAADLSIDRKLQFAKDCVKDLKFLKIILEDAPDEIKDYDAIAEAKYAVALANEKLERIKKKNNK